jgi:hypothetical protein
MIKQQKSALTLGLRLSGLSFSTPEKWNLRGLILNCSVEVLGEGAG